MAEKKKQKLDKGQPPVVVSVPLKYSKPDLPSRYANQMTIQFGPHECYVSFYEAQPPFIVGSDEEIREQRQKLSHVDAECVARIVMSPDFVPKMISALQESFAKHQAVMSPGGAGPNEENKDVKEE